jgi:hypothetical protein
MSTYGGESQIQSVAFLFLVLWMFSSSSLALSSVINNNGCNKPAVLFVFGDSNSDTGGLVSGLGFPVNLPNGRTFFHRSTGRLSDGRLVIDLLCKFFTFFQLLLTLLYYYPHQNQTISFVCLNIF